MRHPVTADQPAGATAARRRSTTESPVAIEVRGLRKTFRIPEHRMTTFKERATHPLTRIAYRRLDALRDVSFDVHQGEFFGIVGRNGSGKSTLLKILASIYRGDAGTVRVAGRLAPFIELGVGFDPELTARENVILGGVLIGLTQREAARRHDAVIDFAELHEFAELKLKNYSSGMLVRLAFAIMVQADSDIMLIDEVLAVGDASFAQKCMDVFYERRRQGKTMVLVTHDMATVQSLCHRAMVLHEGELDYLGDAEDAALRYYRLNFGRASPQSDAGDEEPGPVIDVHARVVDAALRDEAGERSENAEQGVPIVAEVVFEAAHDLPAPIFAFNVLNPDGVVVCAFNHALEQPVAAGQHVRLLVRLENRLVAGRYYLDCWIRQDDSESVMALQAMRVLRFVVFGTASRLGVVTLEAHVEAEVEGP
jgi:ABC-type polysaccharide/polyol phosphate transport system ATPase subunit